MNRRQAAVVVALAVLVALAGLYWLARPPRGGNVPRERGAPQAEPAAAPGAAVEEPRAVTLWLPTTGGRIGPLAATIADSAELHPRLTALLGALLDARPEGDLAPVFTAAVHAAALVVGADGTLYVDLRADDGGPPPGAGSTLETQRIYSIVHTVLRNESRIERVVLLWNGQQRESLEGHVDTGRALYLRPELEAP